MFKINLVVGVDNEFLEVNTNGLILNAKCWYKVSRSNCKHLHLALDHEFGV